MLSSILPQITSYQIRMASSGLSHATRTSMAMGPSVRNLLAHYQIDPAQVTSTGPYQTILKCDVLNYINQHQLKPASTSATVGNTTTSPATATSAKPKVFTPNLDISGYQPKPGPEGFSKIAKKLLDN